ncbi:hypothetical protein [Palleronia sp. LCG004]|uniref:hypothetical protein n=1 Tax=Palleronia sp. LCG004 TaxID=3079304 RepID=UPI0029427EDA|nr:hypothetical protein [Palleronia sp. LCG004]WOI57477.1 hypothetical protein RVY76_06760 [Palleronia sp. LCG004]
MRFNSQIIAVLSLLVAGTSPTLGQELTPLPERFNETVLRAAEISGAIVAGIQMREAPSDELVVSAHIPAEWAGAHVCLRATSIDGRYVAEGEYLVADPWAGGTMSVAYESQYPELLAALSQDQLGVRINRGSCDLEAREELAITNWNAKGGEEIDILLNSFQAEMVFLYVGDAATPIRCTPLDDLQPLAFDTECRIGEIPSGPVTVEIIRVVGQKPMPPTELTIWFDES